MQDFNFNQYWVKSSSKLGGVYPYYNIEKNDSFTLSFPEILADRRSKDLPIAIDSNALITKLCLPYLLGNRTLIEGIHKTPWMSEYKGDGQWEPHHLPKHGQEIPDMDVFINKLKIALLDEASEYISGYSTVGILLSGGMDSRIVAGVLRELQLKKDSSFRVVALTWGLKESRDVVYAQRIAQQFDWDIIHYPLTAEILSRNIIYAGQHGAEFSAFHLHAMEDVANTPGIDVIIAGSYGDSVGRAEFSGTHVTALKSIIPQAIDPFGFLKNQAVKKAKKEMEIDLIDSPHLKLSVSNLRRREIEQEMHYMRRMLQACMQTISIKTPVYQLFTHLDVFSLMWGLDPAIRNNNFYTLLLNKLPGNLLDIPWARNGKRYHKPNENALDDLPKSYHQYGTWFRNELKEGVLERIYSENIYNLGIFNEKGLDSLINNWSKSNTKGINRLDESVAWLCSLHELIQTYKIYQVNSSFKTTNIDYFRSLIGNANANVFINIRNRLRS